MPRPKRTIRPIEKNISLPEDIVARVELELWSDLEGKVPFGGWQRFIVGLINKHFTEQDNPPNKAYAVTGFKGFNPVGTAAVVVASGEAEALALLRKAREDRGMPISDTDGTFVELVMLNKGARILCDGDY